MSVTVEEIKDICFLNISLEEKIHIKMRGRATSDVEITQTTKEKGLYIWVGSNISIHPLSSKL